jgi:Leucine-rich repeat (LRR) protein
VLKQLPNLRVLDLNGTQRRNSGQWSVVLTDPEMDSIGGLGSLQRLRIAGAKITDAGVARLAGLTRLRALDLGRTQVTGAGLESLAALPLEELGLWNAERIDDSAAAALARMSRLQVLDLSETKVTDATLVKLGALPLRRLYVAGTNVTAPGVETFRRAHAGCEVSWK